MEAADPDVAVAVDGDGLGAVEGAIGGVATIRDDGAGAGDAADTVAEVVGDPDVALLVDGEAGGVGAAVEVGEGLAVGETW